MDVSDLHRYIDEWAAKQNQTEGSGTATEAETEVARVLPEGKRVIRTKNQGDRVYLLDEVKKTRQWVNSNDPTVPSPDLLAKLGFEMGDVVEIEDSELFKYQPGPVIWKVD